ncbi:MAG: pyroglutamyl-peptidase I [Bacilli bacterium]
MKILVTGFDPFGNESINPSYEAVKLLPETILDAQIVKMEVPTVMAKSVEKVVKKIEEINPDVVINVGQAGGRFVITPEKVAINLNDFRICDNEGNQPLNEKIYKDGENAYFTTLPVKAMVSNMKNANIPAAVSYSAGTFVCNHIMYGVLYHIQKSNLPIRAGFIHIPFMLEQVIDKANQPAMNLSDMALGLEKAIEAVIFNSADTDDLSGTIC